jgi:prolyl-tRNA synthetase
MNATFLAQDSTEKPFEMGCYGIGVSRILSAAIEQNHDARGIQWPVSIAPFEVAVLAVDPSELAEKLYLDLRHAGIDAILDDREERPGVKFNDADLIGYPLQIIVGRKAAEGIVEVKIRKTGARLEMAVGDLVAKVQKAIEAARNGGAIVLGDA